MDFEFWCTVVKFRHFSQLSCCLMDHCQHSYLIKRSVKLGGNESNIGCPTMLYNLKSIVKNVGSCFQIDLKTRSNISNNRFEVVQHLISDVGHPMFDSFPPSLTHTNFKQTFYYCVEPHRYWRLSGTICWWSPWWLFCSSVTITMQQVIDVVPL